MKINISHGNGGIETSELIDHIFMKYFINPINTNMEDAAVFDLEGSLAFTTDSFVVKPIFFPGGDIGRLAVCGTVNDILTTGGEPKYLSASFIIEEGFDTEDLHVISKSMLEASREANVRIVTGDTKVIEGNGGIYMNTSGIGVIKNKLPGFKAAKESDVVIVTGTLGDHHACILSQRMGICNGITSDAAPLNNIIFALEKEKIGLHGMRDITRGGLATVLNEISKSCALQIEIEESRIPVSQEVNGLCKILGLDPLYMGNEGKMLIIVPKEEAESALNAIRKENYGANAEVVGQLKTGNGVVLHTKLGGQRILNSLTGEGLPRIC